MLLRETHGPLDLKTYAYKRCKKEIMRNNEIRLIYENSFWGDILLNERLNLDPNKWYKKRKRSLSWRTGKEKSFSTVRNWQNVSVAEARFLQASDMAYFEVVVSRNWAKLLCADLTDRKLVQKVWTSSLGPDGAHALDFENRSQVWILFNTI